MKVYMVLVIRESLPSHMRHVAKQWIHVSECFRLKDIAMTVVWFWISCQSVRDSLSRVLQIVNVCLGLRYLGYDHSRLALDRVSKPSTAASGRTYFFGMR